MNGPASLTLSVLDARVLRATDGCRPQRWLRTHRGDVALEHQP